MVLALYNDVHLAATSCAHYREGGRPHAAMRICWIGALNRSVSILRKQEYGTITYPEILRGNPFTLKYERKELELLRYVTRSIHRHRDVAAGHWAEGVVSSSHRATHWLGSTTGIRV